MRGRRRRAPALPHRRPLRFEPLEDRRVLAALIVNSPLDNTIAGDGLVTLREAILAANNDTTTDLGHTGSGADEITFDFGHDGPETIVLTKGQVTIDGDVRITGAGRDLLTIDASGNDTQPDVDNGSGSRLFEILLRPAIQWNVRLRGMTLTGGDSNWRGGAILADGHLTLDDMRIIDNSATNSGGAIYTMWSLAVAESEIVDNGARTSGGGVYALNSSSVVLTNSQVARNSAGSGGGMWLQDTSVTIDGSTISDNHSSAGGGIYIHGSDALFTNVAIAGNEATSGGGVFAFHSRLRFNTSQISDNHALTGTGGGIHINNFVLSTGSLTLNSTQVTGNTSGQHGGGVYSSDSLVAANDSWIADNDATLNGGGIAVRDGQLRVIRTRVTGNTAGSNGGGLAANTARALSQRTLYVADSMLDNNTADGAGGGVYAYRQSSPTIMRSTLHTNAANHGGAIRIHEVTSLGVVQSTVSGNHAVTSGGGLSALDSHVSLAHSTVTGNSAASNPDGTGGGGGIIAYGNTQLSLGHTIVAGNSEDAPFGPDVLLFPGPGFGSPTLTASYSLIGDNRTTGLTEAPIGSPDAEGNLIGAINGQGVVDPKLAPLADNGGLTFLDGSRLLTHALLPGNPAINAGDPSAVAGMNGLPEHDQRGEPFARVFGGRIDMGAYESQFLTLLVDTLVDEDDGDHSDGDFSLREAIRLNNETLEFATIEFDAALTTGGPASVVLTHGELVVSNPLYINGPGANLVTIDASGNDPTPDQNNGDGSRAFLIDNGSSSRISAEIGGLTITGGDSSGEGGAILSRENLVLAASVITGNSASSGGGIRTVGGALTIDGTTISDNIAKLEGGGLNVDRASVQGEVLVVTNSTITNNEAPSGGGIVVADDARIVDATISDNRAASQGGGILLRRLSTADFLVAIESSRVTENSAENGGGIYGADLRSDVRLEINDSSIADNTATRSGGGIYLSDIFVSNQQPAALDIRDSTVTGNFANHGGGIFLGGNAGSLERPVTNIVGSSISGNSAVSRGGAIYSMLRGQLVIRDSEFLGNAAGPGEAAIFVNRQSSAWLVMSDSTVASSVGSGLRLIGPTSALTNVTLTGNSGRGVVSSGGLTMIDCEVNGNAGGIESFGRLTVNGGTIHSNVFPSTQGGGGGIYARQSNVSLNSITIIDNATGGRGGGIYAYESALDVNDCVIEGNSARSGGGIYYGDVWSVGTLTVANSTISGNTATNEGGGIRSGPLVLTGSLVSNNRAVAVLSYVDSLGGGISARGTATIRDSSVTNNTTSGVAGGVSALDVTIERSNISGNSTTRENGFGGGIYAFDSVSVLNSTVAGNFTTGAGAVGGGIASDRVTITQSTISGNRTEGANAHGGGISASGITVVSHSTIADNQALHETATGGGLWRGGSQTTISSSILANNSAGGGSPDLRALSSPVNPLPVSYSLIGNTDGLITLGPGNLTNVDPLLGPLAANGGPTMTHALLPGSPAIDAGEPSAAAGVNDVPMFDQRGGPFGRVVDGDGAVGARIDMGAVERQPNPLPADYNFNGVVDAADYVLWRKNVGVPTDRGDGDGDGDVDPNDYDVWRTNFGTAYADEPAAVSAAIVDEDWLQGLSTIHTAGHAGSGTQAIGTAGHFGHGESSTSSGARVPAALPVDLALLARLRTAGSTAANESTDDFQNISADDQHDSEDGSRQAIELVFAGFGRLNARLST